MRWRGLPFRSLRLDRQHWGSQATITRGTSQLRGGSEGSQANQAPVECWGQSRSSNNGTPRAYALARLIGHRVGLA